MLETIHTPEADGLPGPGPTGYKGDRIPIAPPIVQGFASCRPLNNPEVHLSETKEFTNPTALLRTIQNYSRSSNNLKTMQVQAPRISIGGPI